MLPNVCACNTALCHVCIAAEFAAAKRKNHQACACKYELDAAQVPTLAQKTIAERLPTRTQARQVCLTQQWSLPILGLPMPVGTGNCNVVVQVNEVQPGQVVVTDAPTKEERNVEFGTCIWTTGIKMHPLVVKLAKTLPQGRHHALLSPAGLPPHSLFSPCLIILLDLPTFSLRYLIVCTA